jgi:photosystem II stability/assembly factor-like uncharacterized protein
VGSLPAGTGARVVLIDPQQPTRLYAAGESGVYRSDDAGRNWEAASEGLPAGGVTALALNPRAPGRLYAATPSGPLFLSEDGAGSWQALPGPRPGAGR